MPDVQTLLLIEASNSERLISDVPIQWLNAESLYWDSIVNLVKRRVNPFRGCSETRIIRYLSELRLYNKNLYCKQIIQLIDIKFCSWLDKLKRPILDKDMIDYIGELEDVTIPPSQLWLFAHPSELNGLKKLGLMNRELATNCFYQKLVVDLAREKV